MREAGAWPCCDWSAPAFDGCFRSTVHDRRFGQLEINLLLGHESHAVEINFPGVKYLSSTTTQLRAKPCRARWQEAGYDVICFADSAALLSQVRTRIPVCVLLEVRKARSSPARHSQKASRRKLSRADLRHVREWRYLHGGRRHQERRFRFHRKAVQLAAISSTASDAAIDAVELPNDNIARIVAARYRAANLSPAGSAKCWRGSLRAKPTRRPRVGWA